MKKRWNKAQISVFVIVAVFIIVVIGIYFFMKNKDPGIANIDPEISPIYDYFDNCIDGTSIDAVSFIAQSGGYYFSPAPVVNNIPYYSIYGVDFMLSKNDVESELNKYMNDQLYFCALEFKDIHSEHIFPDYNVSIGTISTDSTIREDRIIFDISYPIMIVKGEKTFDLEFFRSEVPSRISQMYDSSKLIIEDQAKHNDSICLTCIYDIAQLYDFYVDMNDYDNKTVIFSITDEKSTLNNKSTIWNFAIKYDR